MDQENDIHQFDEDEDPFPENYDLEKIFDEKIHPMMKTVLNICSEYGIPMVAAFQYANSEKKIMMHASAALPPGRTSEKITAAADSLFG